MMQLETPREISLVSAQVDFW